MSAPWKVLGLGLILLACGGKRPPPQPSFAAEQRSGLVDITIDLEEYEVVADTAAGLRQEMTRLGPRGADGTPYDGYAKWHLKWRYGYDKDTGWCGPTEPRVSVTLSYTMPRAEPTEAWTPQLSRRWTSYLDALWEHEQGHGDIAVDHAETLVTAMGASAGAETCGDLDTVLNAMGKDALSELREAQQAYDAETDHGRNDGAVFP